MRKRCLRRLSFLLMCLALLTQAAYLPSAGSAFSQQPARLYKVRDKQGKPGFIDKTGKLVIGFDRLPAGTYVGEFSEGLAPICFKDASGGGCRGVGFIDETGEIVIEPRFKHTGSFSEGLAFVRTEEATGFINRLGEVVIKLKVAGARDFHEGLAAVELERGWGFIDRTGKIVTGELYSRVENFSEGLAAVAVGIGLSAKYGFINQKGEVVIPLRFTPPLGRYRAIMYLGRFSEGLARVKVGKLYGYIDKTGEFIIQPRFRDADDFSEGLASVMTENGENGYIDKSGGWVIVLRNAAGNNFTDQSGRVTVVRAVAGNSFKEGLAPVAFTPGHGAFGYIDRTGKVVIAPRFDGASEFVDGVAEVYFYGVVVNSSGRLAVRRSGYIDRTGKYLWQPQ